VVSCSAGSFECRVQKFEQIRPISISLILWYFELDLFAGEYTSPHITLFPLPFIFLPFVVLVFPLRLLFLSLVLVLARVPSLSTSAPVASVIGAGAFARFMTAL